MTRPVRLGLAILVALGISGCGEDAGLKVERLFDGSLKIVNAGKGKIEIQDIAINDLDDCTRGFWERPWYGRPSYLSPKLTPLESHKKWLHQFNDKDSMVRSGNNTGKFHVVADISSVRESGSSPAPIEERIGTIEEAGSYDISDEKIVLERGEQGIWEATCANIMTATVKTDQETKTYKFD